MKTVITTSLALLAFAGNSILCRIALGNASIDAASFTTIRLASGALMLWLVLLISNKSSATLSKKNGWSGALFLFVYAAGFSYAYNSLETGVGALILFGSVQLTMVGISILSGHKPAAREWLGIGLALFGLYVLFAPDLNPPSLTGFALMVIAGAAWGIYTHLGSRSSSALQDTTTNFVRSLPLVAILLLVTSQERSFSNEGVLLAVVSGAITSGLGYAVWYTALRGLRPLQAGVLQLTVPIVAAAGGIIFLNEALTLELVAASVLILAGTLMTILHKHKAAMD